MKTALFALLLSCLVQAQAALMDLSDKPLVLQAQVAPNVFFEIDDSGSMDWEITTRPHWHFCEYDSNAPHVPGSGTCTSGKQDYGLWSSYSGQWWFFPAFEYIYPNGDNAYSTNCQPNSSAREAMLSCPDAPQPGDSIPYQNDWRILSSDFNVIYYNPQQSYKPWQGPCLNNGTACGNATFGAARSDPREGSDGYNNTRDLTGFIYEVWADDRGYTGTRPRRGNNLNVNSTANGEVDLWDSHTRYTVQSSSIKVEKISYSPDSNGLHPAVTETSYISDPDTVNTIKQNIANWYSYYRRRSFATKAAVAAVISTRPDFRYGASVINDHHNFFVEVPPSSTTNFTTHNRNLLGDLFSFDWSPVGTPLRRGLQRVGQYFDNTDGKTDPILPESLGGSCQKNFAILMTDGYWNGSSPGVGDRDDDGIDNTLADVAKYYYDKDLSSLPDKVKADTFDSATHQHMVTYGVAFGVTGNLTDSDNDSWPNPPLTEGSDWGNPTACSSCPEKIDDLWHASFNGKGAFISAYTPQELVAGLTDTLSDISNRIASTAAVALSTGFISSDSRVYQARFQSSDWGGQLLSFPIHADEQGDNFGELDTSGSGPQGSEWDASEKIPSYFNRNIVTYNGTNGIPFRWSNLTNTQKSSLNDDENILNYLRGDDSKEARNGGAFRNRSSRLGDIINSSPAFVGAPPFRYNQNNYAQFRQDNISRRGMIYVGANDGMLHAFDAETGVEKFAYIPNKVFNNLAALADDSYIHKYFVDGAPTFGDVYFNSAWHTVLAGGLNKGGQGIYLLDITDPDSFSSETSAATKVLWEFTDADDADLGYTFSRPAIVKMKNDKWAVIFGNGYNNTESDGAASATGHAVLYITFIEQGLDGSWSSSDFIKLDTEAGTTASPNGLATATPVDVDGDHIADYIYAGDLLGNLWKFDVSSPNTADWKIAFGLATPEPLFNATDSLGNPQPITVRPEVGRTPFGNGIMVYFGTGKFLENSDVSNSIPTQSFYGILDENQPVTSRTSLKQQTVTGEYIFNGEAVRTTTNALITDQDLGWYLDLPGAGERNVSESLLRGGRIIFVTMSAAGDSCSSGGESWLMELDAYHGSRLNTSPFDLDGDGEFTESDYVSVDGGKLPVSGKKSNVGIINKPGVGTSDGKEIKYTAGTQGTVETVTESQGQNTSIRNSWRQVR